MTVAASCNRRLIGAILIVPLLFVCANAAEPTLIGSGSCATSTCHGGVIDQGPAWNHSLSTWTAKDPHAGAGMLLRDEDSRRIVIALNSKAAKSPEVFDTVLRSRCISCHATSTPELCNETGLLDDSVLVSGVSCESCHGAASEWLDPHLQASWAGPQRFEPATGMIDTESIVGRSETCVRCHIGSRTANGMVRDMNHDIIAAGHPALRFDALLYNENLPKHWNVSGAVENEFSASPVRTRAVGRAINLAAAASLSAERAAGHLKDRKVPWPELSDYDCFACHQSLSMQEYNLPSTDTNKSPLQVSDGLPVWNSWHTNNQAQFRGNRPLLERLSPHLSKPEDVIAVATRIAELQRVKAADYSKQTYDAKVRMTEALRALAASPPHDWHQAAVTYLELDAATRQLEMDAEMADKAAKIRQVLSEVEQLLRFDQQAAEGTASVFDSPVRFDPQQFQKFVLNRLSKI
ncbi:MAG: multiheme c-type cytochrome [Rubripirellula sp.]